MQTEWDRIINKSAVKVGFAFFIEFGQCRFIGGNVSFIGSKKCNAETFKHFINTIKRTDRTSAGNNQTTYAVPMIIGEVRRYQRDNNAVRVSRGMRDLAYKALQAKERICGSYQRDATMVEIATELGVSEKDVGDAIEAIAQPISLFDSVYGDGEDTVYVIDKLADESESDEVWVENISLREAMKRLSPREMGIIDRRFYKGKTQMEIAAEIGISQAQVSRLEKGSIEKLRKYMS